MHVESILKEISKVKFGSVNDLLLRNILCEGVDH